MTVETIAGMPLNKSILDGYLSKLVNKFFKILPMRENNEETLTTYMQSLQLELLGLQALITVIKADADYMTLLSILQYLIDCSDCSISVVKREVFRAVSICNRMRSKYTTKEDCL